MKSNNYKYEEDSSSLKLNSTIFQCADEVKLRIPTSCGRLGECHECIVEILNGDTNLSKRTKEEMFLKEPFRLACQAKIISKKEKLSFRPRNRDRKILTDCNMMLVCGFLRAFVSFEDNRFLYEAQAIFEFIFNKSVS